MHTKFRLKKLKGRQHLGRSRFWL